MPEATKHSKAGWTTVAFGTVVRQVKDRVEPEESGLERYVAGEHMDSGDLRIRRWGEIGDGYLGPAFHMRFKPGHVLYGSRRTYLRKVAVADFEGVTANTTYVLESANPTVLLPELLPFIMQTESFTQHSVRESKGSVNPYVNFSDLAWFEFALPPIDVQGRFVRFLETTRLATDRIGDLAVSLANVERAMLSEMFGKRYGEPPTAKQAVPLHAVAEVRTGLAKGREPDSTTTTRPYLSVSNVKDGELDLSVVKEIVVETDRIERYRLLAGDVLMTEGGDLDKLGRGTVWQEEIPGCLHQNHVFAVRVDQGVVDPWYIAAMARSPYGRSYFLQCAKRSSNLASVSKAQVSSMLVPLCPISEQRHFLRSYHEIRQGQLSCSLRVEKLRTMLGRVMDRFGGNHAI